MKQVSLGDTVNEKNVANLKKKSKSLFTFFKSDVIREKQ